MVVTALLQVARLKPLYGILVPLFVVGFFLAALVAIALNRNRTVRNGYLGGFFALLLVVNLFVPVTPAPVVKWHKFSEVRDTEKTEYVFRVVDADGRELTYDEDATLDSGSVALSLVQVKMRTEFSPTKNEEVAQWLLERANTHRTDVMAESPKRFLSFPRHGLSNAWTATTLAGYSEFTTIRLYQVDVTVSDDGTRVTSYEEALLYEYHDEDGTTVEMITDDEAHAVDVSRKVAVPVGGVAA